MFSCIYTAGQRAFFGPLSISETDHLFTKQLLCQLSYVGVTGKRSGTLFGEGRQGLICIRNELRQGTVRFNYDNEADAAYVWLAPA